MTEKGAEEQVLAMDRLHLYGEHGWDGDAKFKKAIESFNSIAFLFPMPINAFLL